MLTSFFRRILALIVACALTANAGWATPMPIRVQGRPFARDIFTQAALSPIALWSARVMAHTISWTSRRAEMARRGIAVSELPPEARQLIAEVGALKDSDLLSPVAPELVASHGDLIAVRDLLSAYDYFLSQMQLALIHNNHRESERALEGLGAIRGGMTRTLHTFPTMPRCSSFWNF